MSGVISTLNLSSEVIEGLHREHGTIKDIVVFGDRLGQLVALVISEETSETALRHLLDMISNRRQPDCPEIVDFASLHLEDPLLFALFTAAGLPRRELIWLFLVGSIETPTRSGYRLTPTGSDAYTPHHASLRIGTVNAAPD